MRYISFSLDPAGELVRKMYNFLYEETYLIEDSYFWFKSIHKFIELFVKREYKKISNPLNIIDVGCGSGKLLTILNKYGKTRGIDCSRKAITFCRKRGLKEVKVEDINYYEFGESKYDIITCIDVLYHRWIRDDIIILNKLYKSLKDNGIVILDLAAFNFLRRGHDKAVMGTRRHTIRKIIPDLEKIGYKIEIRSYRLSFLFVPALAMKYFEKLQKKDDVKSDFKQLPSLINWLFFQMSCFENKIIKYLNLPIGTSLFIIARK